MIDHRDWRRLVPCSAPSFLLVSKFFRRTLYHNVLRQIIRDLMYSLVDCLCMYLHRRE